MTSFINYAISHARLTLATLAFLLFAGAMSLDLRALRDRAWAVATLALFGTLISTAIVGGAFWFAADALGQPVPLAWALCVPLRQPTQ